MKSLPAFAALLALLSSSVLAAPPAGRKDAPVGEKTEQVAGGATSRDVEKRAPLEPEWEAYKLQRAKVRSLILELNQEIAQAKREDRIKIRKAWKTKNQKELESLNEKAKAIQGRRTMDGKLVPQDKDEPKQPEKKKEKADKGSLPSLELPAEVSTEDLSLSPTPSQPAETQAKQNNSNR